MMILSTVTNWSGRYFGWGFNLLVFLHLPIPNIDRRIRYGEVPTVPDTLKLHSSQLDFKVFRRPRQRFQKIAKCFPQIRFKLYYISLTID